MSDTSSTPNIGETIAQDLSVADAFLTPVINSFNPVVGAGIHLGLKLVQAAEPAIYNAVVATLQGKPLTPEQQAALASIETKLQNPGQYFA